MGPKRRTGTPSDPLSKAEEQLLAIAVRLNQAMLYREKHDIDELWYAQAIAEELVRRYFMSVVSWPTNDNVQESVEKIFAVPENSDARFHPAIALVAEEFERAGEAGTAPDFNAFDIQHIWERCAQEAKEHPDWNLKLTTRTLTLLVGKQPVSTHWWLPGEPDFNDDDDDDEGE
jgi:hypothetical protein